MTMTTWTMQTASEHLRSLVQEYGYDVVEVHITINTYHGPEGNTTRVNVCVEGRDHFQKLMGYSTKIGQLHAYEDVIFGVGRTFDEALNFVVNEVITYIHDNAQTRSERELRYHVHVLKELNGVEPDMTDFSRNLFSSKIYDLLQHIAGPLLTYNAKRGGRNYE